MAKPNVEHGFLMVPLDLLPAVMTADLANGEMIVLSEALLQRYGPERRERVVLDLPTIEANTAMSCKNARRALKGLVAAKILVACGGNAYLVNDDYETWCPGGHPFAERLGGGLVRYCFGALARFGRRANKSKPVGVQVDSTSTNAGVQADSVRQPSESPVGLISEARNPSGWTPKDVDASVSGVVAKPSPNGHSATPLACAGARASEELDFRPDTHTPREDPKPAADAEPFEPGAPDTAPKPETADPFGLTPEEAGEVERARTLADRLFPPGPGGNGIGGMIAANPKVIPEMPVSWWRPALQKLHGRPPGQRHYRYLCGILNGFAENGGPDEKPKPKPGGAYRSGPREVSSKDLYPVVQADPEYLARRAALQAKAAASQAKETRA